MLLNSWTWRERAIFPPSKTHISTSLSPKKELSGPATLEWTCWSPADWKSPAGAPNIPARWEGRPALSPLKTVKSLPPTPPTPLPHPPTPTTNTLPYSLRRKNKESSLFHPFRLISGSSLDHLFVLVTQESAAVLDCAHTHTHAHRHTVKFHLLVFLQRRQIKFFVLNFKDLEKGPCAGHVLIAEPHLWCWCQDNNMQLTLWSSDKPLISVRTEKKCNALSCFVVEQCLAGLCSLLSLINCN